MELTDRDIDRIADAVVRRFEDMANNAEIARFAVHLLKEEQKQRLLDLLNDSPKPPDDAPASNPPPETPAEP